MRPSRSSLLCAVLMLSACLARAGDGQLEALTCTAALHSDPAAVNVWKELQSRGRRIGDGQFVLDGRFTSGNLCIQNANVGAAFGVLVVVAEVCEDSAEPLRDFVLSRRPDLRPSSPPLANGVLAEYQSAKVAFSLFKGAPSLVPTPDPGSHRVSYVCSFQSGGAQ